MKTARISVRNLVEFILRKGSIDERHTSDHTAQEGARIHRQLQKAGGENYQKEVFLSLEVSLTEGMLTVEGRADGVITEDQQITIDEIKTSEPEFEDLLPEQIEMFWNQVKCYGHIYCLKENLEQITLQLTYFQTTEKKITRQKLTFSALELADFFTHVVTEYEKWLVFQEEWQERRNQSLKQLEFPFPDYRKGQRELAVAVYKTILSERQLFVEAPTGIGKTISTLFPSLKAIGEGKAQRIFYLTAKTITRTVAEEGIAELKEKQAEVKSVTLTAKDKICFLTERNCTPEACPFAKGYYDRINDVLWDVLHKENQLTREVIETYAQKHTVCPFELSLDLSNFCDIVIGDYNYLFDPRVYLRRFFENPDGQSLFLVDEAHNLVDRGREMYSQSLNKNTILTLKNQSKNYKKLYKALTKLNQEMIQLRKVLEEKEADFFAQAAPVESLTSRVYQFTEVAKEWLAENPNDDLQEMVLSFYFEALNYTRISEFYDDHFVTYLEQRNHDIIIKQYCIDPSFLLNQSLEKGRAAILFSASLTPLDYYSEVLGGNEERLTYRLASPFDEKRQLLLVDQQIQTTYRQREASLPRVVAELAKLAQGKTGNYLFFFPSYRYLDDVYQLFIEAYPELRTLIQQNQMSEEEREVFLTNFEVEPKETLIGFCVLGGIFSEGIDLKGTRLIGVGIVGVGLPQLSHQQDLIKNYYDEKGLGFQYAYQIPGMNKVLQAAGRVIRTMTDKGVVLLLDQRFGTNCYQQYFPEHWRGYLGFNRPEELPEKLQDFWQDDN
ncbi:ATP-dependent DNA helicase [Enterococcus sp. HY326]|uniref:ATP-dependent DNA helicase n=1 Tax=Enterococcus sp. HY326 TaxID=2971265 RepID=UPI00223FE6F5|nr:ATP-dependent DNA helicase [Enterococcus sp. HY326]